MNDVNVPLLRKVVEWVENQATLPEMTREWSQGDWWKTLTDMSGQYCGTAFCVAGYVAMLEGWTPIVNPRASFMTRARHMRRDEETREIPVIAAEALGITDDEARVLFAGSNSAKDIRMIAENVAGERL